MKLLLAMTFVAFVAFTSTAQAFGCRTAPRSWMTDTLRDKHKEQPVGIGIGERQNYAVELYKSKAGSFTVMLSFENGASCIVASGKHWQTLEPQKTLFDPVM